jgi:hypothetical protein
MLFCKLDSSEPGPRHRFRFIYDGNVSNFLVIAHPLDGSRPFTSSVCRLEEIMPGGSGIGVARDPTAYAIGQKFAVSEHAFQATFDISKLVSHNINLAFSSATNPVLFFGILADV